MLDIIKKDSKTALSTQVSKMLIRKIRGGEIKPGNRLPSERCLAKRFGISRGTVIEALDLLEKQNYIERISAKGTFVTDDVNHELSLVKIAFPFPEESISPTSLGSLENWGIASEIYRGIIQEAKAQNTEISFIHFEEAANEIQLARQLRRLEDMDSTIFIGHQLLQLQHALIKRGTLGVLIAPKPDIEGQSVITDDLENACFELANLAKDKNYKRLRIIYNSSTKESLYDKRRFEEKTKALMGAFEKVKIETSPDWFYEIENNDPQNFAKIFSQNNFNLTDGIDIIYYENTNTVPAFYRYCYDNGIAIGHGIGVFGYADGVSLQNLIPAFTYSKKNSFETGRRACARCLKIVQTGKQSSCIEFVKNILMEGESV